MCKGMTMSKKNYFQYYKELDIPVYISIDLTHFDQGVQDLLAKLKFSKLTDSEEASVHKSMSQRKDARLLNISEATALVGKQINMAMESDRYGDESIIPKAGYRVYRYKGMGLLVFSFGAREWSLGCYKDFGSRIVHTESMVMMNRFLSWALSSLGYLGIWGASIDEGMVAQRYSDSKAELVFIDIFNNRVLTIDGMKKLSPRFKVLRLDPMIKGRNIKMSQEEYLSFLSAHCSYFDYSGLSVPVRQMIQAFARMTEGLVHPEESFRPRTDLSL
jgi:hypothetical protein